VSGDQLEPNIGTSGLVTLDDVIPRILEEFKPHLMDLGDAMTEVGKETKWVIHRLLAEADSSILTAMPGVGKSWFAQQAAVCVAMGKPFLGREVKAGLVIYFAFEGAQQTVRRLHRLGLPAKCENFKIWISGTDGSAPATWLEKIIAKQKPTLIILDCLQNIAQAKEGNSYSESYKLLGPLMQYAAKTKVHILALHHSSAKEERTGVGAAIGSTGIPANFGTVLNLRRLDPSNEDGSSPRVLSCGNKHRNGILGPEDIPTVIVTANPFNGRLVVAGRLVNVRELLVGNKIIEALTLAPEPLTRADLIEAASTKKQNFERVLGRLVKLGVIAKTGTGQHTGRGNKNPLLTYSLGPTSATAWEQEFKDAGAHAFDPPPIPADSEPVEEVATDF
jgi:hypothetical protein